MTPPVCGIVGSSGAGKTRLVEQLAPELVRRGLALGYLKHAAHGAEVDRQGSDTARVRGTGTTRTVLVGPYEVACFEPRHDGPLDATALAARLTECDVVLAEGFSDGPHPKIRIRSAGSRPREVADPVLLDLERNGDGVDDRDLQRALEVVLDLVAAARGPRVRVVADGVDVPVYGFAAEVVASGVAGIVGALRGVDRPTTLTVTVSFGPEGPVTAAPHSR